MALSRNYESVTWSFRDFTIFGAGADFLIPPGANESNFFATDMGAAGEFLVPILDLPNFSIDVYVDGAAEIDIEVGHNSGNIQVLSTLVCAAGANHNTIYDLPAPYNQNGILTVTSKYMRLRFRNPTAGNVGPVDLVARIWR